MKIKLLFLAICMHLFANISALEVAIIDEWMRQKKEAEEKIKMINFINSLTKDEKKINFNDNSWKVLSIRNNGDREVILQRIGSNKVAKNDFLIMTTSQNDYKVMPLADYAFWKRIAVGGIFVRSYLTNLSQNYYNYIFEKATPWLNSLRTNFNATLKKFRFPQSK